MRLISDLEQSPDIDSTIASCFIASNFCVNDRFFMGKNKVMIKALGTTTEDEQQNDLRKVSALLKGDSGALLFTNEDASKVIK